MTDKRKATGAFVTALLLFACLSGAFSQSSKDGLRLMTEGTSFGFGSYRLEDTYLSPFTYAGWGGRILNERVTEIKPRISRQRIIGVDVATTKNPAENVNDFGTFVNYSLAFHYDLLPSGAFKLKTGASGNIMGGFIYNTRNGNNPLSAKVDLDIALSAIFSYTFNICNRPFSLSYQAVLPFAGIFFAPPYGASYYEMFNEGNVSNITAFSSFNNKFSMKNYMALDIPVSKSAIRISYLASYYRSDVKFIESRIQSNTLMIGWVSHFYFK